MAGKRLSQAAAECVYPPGIVVTDFPVLERIANAAGIRYDEWQRGLGTLLFGRLKDGSYAAASGGVTVSICRQTGKTFLFGTLLFMKAVATPNMKIIWTAHHTRTSDETFANMQALARRKALAKYVDAVRRANGQQEIRFRNGSRIMFGSREMGFGRGFDKVDIEMFDEAQILTEKALDSMLPAMNASSVGLAVYAGTPPAPTDPSEVFSNKRQAGLKGAPGMVYVEFSAPRNAKPDDRGAWRKANPSYPQRTGEQAMLRMLNNLGADSFRREALGIWDERQTTETAIDAELWDSTGVKDQPLEADRRIAVGIDMPPDRSVVSIGMASRSDASDKAFVSLAECRDTRADGFAWAADWVAGHWNRLSAVVIDAQSPAMSLLPELQARHIRVTVTGSRDMGQACGRFIDMLESKKLTHFMSGEQPQLDTAVGNARKRPIGSAGAFGWNRKMPDVDISPLVACTLALQGVYSSKRNPNRSQKVMVM